MNKKLVGQRLKKQRKLLNLTQEQFAEKIKISTQFLAEIESGKKGMSANTLYKICYCFGISANVLLFGKEIHYKNFSELELLISDVPTKYLHLINEYVLLLKKTISI